MILSVVLQTWHLSPRWHTAQQLLDGCLWTLSHQTMPPDEIIVVNACPDEHLALQVRLACRGYPLVRVLDVPQTSVNLSRNFNIGIRVTSEQSDCVMMTNPEFLFSPTVLETIGALMDSNSCVLLPIGSLPENVRIGNPVTVWQRWEELLRAVDGLSPSETGVLSCLPREWLFRVRGYDEIATPYNNNDADLHWRAQLDGLRCEYALWEVCQTLHRGHPRAQEWWTVISPAPTDSERTIVRNPDRWGEYV